MDQKLKYGFDTIGRYTEGVPSTVLEGVKSALSLNIEEKTIGMIGFGEC